MIKRVKFKKVKSFLPRDRMQPFFRFNDGVFLYKLTEDQRKMLNVDETNPGVVVVIE
jgi:hypothetical protein